MYQYQYLNLTKSPYNQQLSAFAPFIVFGHSSKLSITPSPSESFGAATGVWRSWFGPATGAGFETSLKWN